MDLDDLFGNGSRDRQGHRSRRDRDHHDHTDRHDHEGPHGDHEDSDAWRLGQGRRHGGGELLRWLAAGPLRSTGARVLAGAAAAVVLLLLGALAVGALRLAGQVPLEGLAAPAVEAARSVLFGK